ncbi:hypothetical protein NADFUDRAFT_82176 [Nadsonia fulvescens var. elongata DSM 6958]|uniref:Large ribosomal subunit protein uL30m n=1 Tax=Nadsonia fulvescens var. elongata DSM 6958 TaxID=857566 RepID=A0A1E3PLZ7_9ASCO|nr:hypothetical protein NADFUDRAFT_82176 [Nadsonia fulvescens var. elongata DSM 6958]
MFYKVTQRKSAVGLPKVFSDTLTVLGLKKINRTRYVPVSQSSAGLIFKVKELVKVELVDSYKSPAQMKSENKSPSGIVIESKSSN